MSESKECVKCGKVSKRIEGLYRQNISDIYYRYQPVNVYICLAQASCKNRQRKLRNQVG